jgi:hypothetical protein
MAKHEAINRLGGVMGDFGYICMTSLTFDTAMDALVVNFLIDIEKPHLSILADPA